MKAAPHLLVAAALAWAGITPQPAAAQESISAKELASRMTANVNDGSAFIRLRMEIRSGGSKSTLQLQLKSRRTKEGSDILYQVLYPKDRKGEAVLLQKHGGKASGKVFSPASGVQNISSMKDSMFGSDLSYEDVIDNFFAWEQQSFAGSEDMGGTPCQILESKPGGGSSYSRVRSWVDLRKLLPKRVEKYAGSSVARSFETTRVAEDDTNRPVVASLVIKRPGQNTETEIEGSNSRHDVVYTDKDFSAEGMQSLAPPQSK